MTILQMKKIEKSKDLQQELTQLRASGKSIGFVPTMGALHEGHLSLIKQSNSENDITVVSIFVNPTQFNNKNDFTRYPRILADDIESLKTVQCDLLFIPSENEMYPKEDTRQFNFGNLDKVMEGKFRPGHFRGVGLIVSKLFEIVLPDKAYFGEKDFQQVAIIKHLTKQLGFNIEIVSCPIIREQDGLAMSSRNMLLSKEQRAEVSLISRTLFESVTKAKSFTVEQTKDWVIRSINKNHYLDVEYFEIVNAETLEPIKNWEENAEKFGCIAVQVGNIRLIDNIRYNL
jgi:pantoate--beta-alanine ligase